MRVQGFLIYRIWYGNCLVYVGRTKQPLQSRIRGHLFSKPMHSTVKIEQVTKIEYAELGSEADMNLYEIYYILRLHPPLNVDDKARDDLSVTYQSWNGKSSRRRSGRVGGRRLRSRTPTLTTCGNAMRRSRRRSRYSAACGRRAKSRNTSSRNGSLHSKKSRSRFPRSCGIGKDQRRSIYVAAGIQSIILRRSSGSRGQ